MRFRDYALRRARHHTGADVQLVDSLIGKLSLAVIVWFIVVPLIGSLV